MDPEKKDVADPERVPNAEDQWMCPFCKKKDFYELSQVWSHFDATDECKNWSKSSVLSENYLGTIKYCACSNVDTQNLRFFRCGSYNSQKVHSGNNNDIFRH